MINVGIIGAGSIVAKEIMKIIYKHSKSKLIYVNSETYINQSVSHIYPIFQGKYDELLFKEYNIAEIKKCNVVFICKPHGESSVIVKNLFEKTKCKIIDMGADFRLKDIKNFEHWYHGANHACFELTNKAAYGLSELHKKEIKKARLIANPGCYATSIILGCAPLLADNLIDPQNINIVASSGISGAGNQPKPGFNMFMDLHGNVKPYKIGGHSHIGEIEQELKFYAPKLGALTFIPQVVPLERGILSVLTFNLKPKVTQDIVYESFNKFYNGCIFIKIIIDRFPEIKDTADTNICEIYSVIDKHSKKLIVLTCLDNLVKGAAGQAVQNMNIMYDLNEITGLI